MIGYIKGYDICNITNKKLDKEEFLSELIKLDSNLKNKILKVLNDNGYVIGLKKKKVLKVVYIFKMDIQQKILKYSESLATKDIEIKTIENFEKAIIEELKEKVTLEEVSKVDWKDIEIVPNESSSFSSLTFSTCLSLGLLFGIIFDNLSMGLLFGCAIGLCFGAVVKKK